MLKKNICYAILAISLVGLIILSVGFYQAISVTMASSPQPPNRTTRTQPPEESERLPSKNANSLQILILGDSIAKGTGDEKGKGFSGYLAESFKNDTSKELKVNDAGLDGLESLGLLEQLQNRSLDQTIAESDLILISIGGNDIKSLLTLNDLAKEDAFNTRLENYVNNLKQTIKMIRTCNPNSMIVFLGLYNPYEIGDNAQNTRLLNTWNYNTQQIVEEDEKGIFIPTSDLMKLNLARYIAKDGLHPNSAGYQALSSRISKSVEPFVSRS